MEEDFCDYVVISVPCAKQLILHWVILMWKSKTPLRLPVIFLLLYLEQPLTHRLDDSRSNLAWWSSNRLKSVDSWFLVPPVPVRQSIFLVRYLGFICLSCPVCEWQSSAIYPTGDLMQREIRPWGGGKEPRCLCWNVLQMRLDGNALPERLLFLATLETVKL